MSIIIRHSVIGYLLSVIIAATTNAGVSFNLNNFNAGEVSPYTEARTDLTKYFSGCRTFENLLVSPYGAAIRRPGTYFINEVRDSNDITRLTPFEFSTQQAYVLEWDDRYIRFYMDGGQIQNDANTGPYEINSPYSSSEVFDLQYIQSADVMYITQSTHMPQKLSRTGHTHWTIEDVNFRYGPFLLENETQTKITPSAKTGNIHLVADGNIFDPCHIGALWEIIYSSDANLLKWTFSATGESNTIPVEYGREWSWTTHDTWDGTVYLERSYDDGTSWEPMQPASYKNDDNIKVNSSEKTADCIYRFKMTDYTSGTCECRLALLGFERKGIARITAYNSPNDVNATVINDFSNTKATKRWAEGAFSPKRGYPKTLAFFGERLCFASTDYNPQTVWFSKTDDWENFLEGDKDDEAFKVEIASNQVNTIQWIIGQHKLFVGTIGGEWAIGPTSGKAITPADKAVNIYSTYGSKNIQAMLINDAVIFVQRQGKKVREMLYNYETDGYQAGDLTVLSEHITGGGITQMAYQQQPDSILWATRSDGTLIGMTYDREQEVFGWHRQVTDGNFESVAVISGNGEDEIWTIVNRAISGTTRRYIEKFMPRNWGTNQTDYFFMDCGLSFDGGATKTITSITKANPGTVTASGHGFADGQQVRITGVLGMTEINNKVFTVHSPTATNFQLRDQTDGINWNTTAYTTYTSGGQVQRVEKNFTNLSHLEGKNVIGVGDGAVDTNTVVSNGQANLNNWANKVHIGLPYTSTLRPQRLHVDLQNGTSQGHLKNISTVILRLYQTGTGLQIGPDANNLLLVPLRKTTAPMGTATPLFTGDTEKIPFPGTYETEGAIYIKQSLPLPMNILAIMPNVEISLDQ